MKIKILGNGGAISDGLPYNAFMIENFFLVETPPDIMNSLFREKISLADISAVYISHFHADHFFGFPMLALRLFFDRSKKNITVFGPAGIKNKALELGTIAFGTIHPVLNWIEEYVEFQELRGDARFSVNEGLSFETIEMSHFIETYGFKLYYNNQCPFCYFADSVWNDKLTEIVKDFSGSILSDLNGEPGDDPQMHISERDVIANCEKASDGNLIFYGTHLKIEKSSEHGFIRYVRAGEVIEV